MYKFISPLYPRFFEFALLVVYFYSIFNMYQDRTYRSLIVL